ncbi:MAG: hypothetical protein LBB60_07760 [Desulfovibrio sp.]|jgi:hypothetical protein|nr:hypothetical protein [Desulfovibrio sp.]
MSTDTRNRYGLYDAPVQLAEKEHIVLTQEDMERQMEDGAFFMDREEAVQSGFLNPYDDDTVFVTVRRTL